MKGALLVVIFVIGLVGVVRTQQISSPGPETVLDNWLKATSTKKSFELTRAEYAALFTPELIVALPDAGNWPNIPSGKMKALRIAKFAVEDGTASVIVNFEAFPGERRDTQFQFQKVKSGEWRISNIVGWLGPKIGKPFWSLATASGPR